MNHDPRRLISTPATLMLVLGVFNCTIGLFVLFTGLLRLLGGDEALPSNSNERFGFLIGTFITYGAALLSVVLSPLMIFGGHQMSKLRRATLVKVGAIFSIIPFTSCCFVFGIPIGIWVLVIMAKPEVKAAFADPEGSVFNPPQPPAF